MFNLTVTLFIGQGVTGGGGTNDENTAIEDIPFPVPVKHVPIDPLFGNNMDEINDISALFKPDVLPWIKLMTTAPASSGGRRRTLLQAN